MTPLLQAQLASAIRWIITVAMAALVKDGVSQSTATGLAALLNPESIAAFLCALVPLVWGILHKSKVNTQIAVAAATGISTATPTAKASAAVAAVASDAALQMAQAPSSIPRSAVALFLCAGIASTFVACKSIDPALPGSTAPAPLVAFTNGSAYILGHVVSSNEVFSASFTASELGAQLLIKDVPGASNYVSDAQLVFQSIAQSGVYNQALLSSNLSAIPLKNASDQALLDGLISTGISLAGAYVNPLVSSNTNSAPYVQAALLGIAQGL